MLSISTVERTHAVSSNQQKPLWTIPITHKIIIVYLILYQILIDQCKIIIIQQSPREFLICFSLFPRIFQCRFLLSNYYCCCCSCCIHLLTIFLFSRTVRNDSINLQLRKRFHIFGVFLSPPLHPQKLAITPFFLVFDDLPPPSQEKRQIKTKISTFQTKRFFAWYPHIISKYLHMFTLSWISIWQQFHYYQVQCRPYTLEVLDWRAHMVR